LQKIPQINNSKTQDDTWIPTTCWMCYNSCSILVHRVNGVIIKVEADPNNPQNDSRICPKGGSAIMNYYNPLRVTKPLRRTNPKKGLDQDPKWEEISWDEAYKIIVDKLVEIRKRDPRRVVLSTFDIHWPTTCMFAFATAYGTLPSNIYFGPAAYWCGNGFHPITMMVHGTFWADSDRDQCKYLIQLGTGTGGIVNHLPPKHALKTADAKMRGMKFVVVDPTCTNVASKADEWVPIRPGTDGAFALAMLNVLLNELGVYDAPYLKQHTNAPYLVGQDGHYIRDMESGKPCVWDAVDSKSKCFDDVSVKDCTILGEYTVNGAKCIPAFQLLKNSVKKWTPEAASRVTTIPTETIRRITKEFAEASNIGGTITIQGVELPYRPVAVDWSKGTSGHAHAYLSCWSIALLNIVVGAIGVPGSWLGQNPVNLTGPKWGPETSRDGLLIPSKHPLARSTNDPYPSRIVTRPQSFTCFELFPVAPYSDTMFIPNLMNPELFNVGYMPEFWIVARANPVFNTVNANEACEALKKIPFILSIAFELNETAQIADIVLPDAHSFERLEPFPNEPYSWQNSGMDPWVYLFRQPIVNSPPGVKSWTEYLFDIAEKAGFLPDMYAMLNIIFDMNPPYVLDPHKKYTYAEICDIALKSKIGPDHGLDYMKKHGYYVMQKKVQEAYPRPFLKGRAPVYLEHLIQAGEDVKKTTKEMSLKWDTSDYIPLPDWHPCPGYNPKSPEYDLFATCHKIPQHTFGFSLNNPWLKELGSTVGPWNYGIKIHTSAAAKKGIENGDEIWLESEWGYKTRGRAVVTEAVHPETVSISGQFGKLALGEPVARGVGPSWNALATNQLEYIDKLSSAHDMCIRVKVYKT